MSDGITDCGKGMELSVANAVKEHTKRHSECEKEISRLEAELKEANKENQCKDHHNYLIHLEGEIETLKEENRHLKDDGPDWYYKTCADRLKAQNEKMREALEKIKRLNHGMAYGMEFEFLAQKNRHRNNLLKKKSGL